MEGDANERATKEALNAASLANEAISALERGEPQAATKLMTGARKKAEEVADLLQGLPERTPEA